MSKNKLYNQSYFCKRIVEEGFDVTRLNIKYEFDDLRKWSIIVNKQQSEYKHNILITCFKNEETKEFSFKFQGKTFDDFMLPTLTMKIIIEILKKAMENTNDTI
jgi:hypothetical protein